MNDNLLLTKEEIFSLYICLKELQSKGYDSGVKYDNDVDTIIDKIEKKKYKLRKQAEKL